MQIKRCAYCGHAFSAKKKNHVFCSRKCFKKHYLREKNKKTYPKWKCPICGCVKKLDYDPKECKNIMTWIENKCDNCGYGNHTNLKISENED